MRVINRLFPRRRASRKAKATSEYEAVEGKSALAIPAEAHAEECCTPTPPLAPPAAMKPGSTHFVVHAKLLGTGAYGNVHLGTAFESDGSSHQVAVKLVLHGRMRPEALTKEAAILDRLSCGNATTAIRFYGRISPGAPGITTDSDDVANLSTSHCFVMEAARGGELFEYIVASKGLCEREAAPFFRQIANGLLDAHALGITHRDLKLENVLFVGAAAPGGTVKLIDWGLAHQHALRLDGSVQPERLHSRVGSRAYMAPEVLAAAKERRSKTDCDGFDAFAADVWSLGICLFAMLVGFFPFERADPGLDWRARKALTAQLEGRSAVDTVFSFYPKRQLHISADAKRLIDSMLCFDPSRRCTLEDVLGSRWLQRGDGLDAEQHAVVAQSANPRSVLHGSDIEVSVWQSSSQGSTRAVGQSPRTSISLAPVSIERQGTGSTGTSASSVCSSVKRSVARLHALAGEGAGELRMADISVESSSFTAFVAAGGADIASPLRTGLPTARPTARPLPPHRPYRPRPAF